MLFNRKNLFENISCLFLGVFVLVAIYSHNSSADPALGLIQDLEYEYDSVGNIEQIIDSSITPTAKTMDYTYDDLYRLQSASSTGFSIGDYSRSYGYDPIGNMTCKSSINSADCLNGGVNMNYTGTGFPTPHAVTAVDGSSYSYDLNGNMSNNGTRDHIWSIRNELIASGDLSFTYDHSGQRVKTTNSATGEETIYVNPYLEIRDGELIYYLYAGGQRVASIKDYGTPEQEITYFHQDHLGGIALATDEEGVVVQVNDYYPFGSSLLTSQLTSTEVNHSFTDKEYEEDLGLYYFEARWMDPRTGRFISEDPLDGTTYSYAANNPLIIIDPTGLYIVETGEIEADDTQDIITDALSDALGIDVSWDDVVGAGFYNPNGGHSYEDGDLVDMVGWFTHADASSPNITSDLNARNDAAAANYNVFSDPRAAWDYAHGEGDLKYDESSVYGARYENGDRKYWSYVYEGQLVRYDAPGNIHLGYVASEGGRMPWAFIYAGNVYSNGGFDDAYDVKMLYWGYQNATPLRDVYRTFR
jgi:RHS repeat-associated protein